VPERDPVSSLAREIIDLYRGPLSDVQFPELDRTVLDLAEGELLDAQSALEAAELALQEARERVSEQVAALNKKAQIGLAYARVFVETKPELRERIELLSAPQVKREREAQSVSAPRRSRRARKDEEESATLFEGAPASEEEPIVDAA
jgi:hypothetical protein